MVLIHGLRYLRWSSVEPVYDTPDDLAFTVVRL
jgi:hypothetical protein